MKKLSLCVVVGALVLAGCSDPAKNGSSHAQAKPPIEYVIGESRLYANLPATTLAYVRIPHILSIASARENALRNALGNEANVREVAKLRKALYDNVLSELDPQVKPILALLFKDLNSALEVALLPSHNPNMIMPTGVFEGTFNYADTNEFQKAMTQLSTLDPQIRITQSPSTPENADIAMGPIVGSVHFNPADKHMQIVIGVSLTQADIEQYRQALKNNPQHPMLTLEKQIDSSHKGLFAWVSTKNVLSSYGNMLPPQNMAMLAKMGFDKADAVAIGAGTADGKGRMKLVYQGQRAGALSLVPQVSQSLGFSTTGSPQYLLTLSLPSDLQFNDIVNTQAQLLGQSEPPLAKIKGAFLKASEIPIDDILAALGPDLSFFEDQAGQFGALKIRSKAKWDALLKQLQSKHQWQLESHQVDGVTVNELSFPSSFIALDDKMRQKMPPWMVRLVENSTSHLYFVEQDGYLILGQVPQVFADREAADNKSNVAHWLEKNRLNYGSSLIAGAGEFSDTPKKIYYGYLSFLQFLSDYVEADVDLYAFPSASQLNLPQSGVFGLQVDTGPDQLSIGMTYELSPAEVALNTPMGAAATIGILAAVALPAYKQYTEKADFSALISAVQAPKTAVEVCVAIKQSMSSDDCESLVQETFGTPPGIELAFLNQTKDTIVIKATDRANKHEYTLKGTRVDGEVEWLEFCRPSSACR